MIFYFSAADLIKLPPFAEKGMREIDLLKRENDETILNMLYPFGIDKDKGLLVQACRHRKANKKIVTNWRYVFEERMDREWLWSGRASLEARIYSTKDLTLIGELSAMGQLFRSSTDGSGAIAKMAKEEEPEASFAHHQEEIRALQRIQEHIRGALLADEDLLFDIKSKEELLSSDVLQMNKMYEGRND